MVDRVIRVRIDPSGAESGGRRVENSLRRVGDTGKRAGGDIRQLGAALAALGLGFSVREIVNLADTFTLLRARLSVVTGDITTASQTLDKLGDVANRTRQGLEATATLFTRFARATDAVGISQERVLAVTETINQAVTVSGATAGEAAGALFQLSQGLAANALRGQELNSVLEQTPRIATAIAEGLGTDIGGLRKLAEEGKLTAEAVVTALEKMGTTIADEFAKIPVTAGQAFTVLQNNLLKTIGAANDATGATSALASAILVLAENTDILLVAFAALASAIAVAALPAVVGFIAALGPVVLTVGAVVAGIGALVVMLTRLKPQFEFVIDGSKQIGSAWDYLSASAAVIGDAFGDMWDKGRIALGISLDLLGLLVDKMFELIGIDVTGFWDGFGDAMYSVTQQGIRNLLILKEIALTRITELDTLWQRIKDIQNSNPLDNLLTGFKKSLNEELTTRAFQSDLEADQVLPVDKSADRLKREAEKQAAILKQGAQAYRDALREIRAEQEFARTGSNAFSAEEDRLRKVQLEITFNKELAKARKDTDNKGANEATLRAIAQRGVELQKEKFLLEDINRLAEGRKVSQEVARQLVLENELLGKSLEERRKIIALDQAREALRGKSKDLESDAQALADLQVQVDKVNRANERQQSLLRSLRPPAQAYNETVADLNMLLQRGAINAEQFGRGLTEAQRAYLSSQRDFASGVKLGLLDLSDEYTNFAKLTRDTLVNSFHEAEDALVEFVSTGKLNFEDLVQSIHKSLAKLAIRQSITGPLAAALGLDGKQPGTGGTQQLQQAAASAGAGLGDALAASGGPGESAYTARGAAAPQGVEGAANDNRQQIRGQFDSVGRLVFDAASAMKNLFGNIIDVFASFDISKLAKTIGDFFSDLVQALSQGGGGGGGGSTFFSSLGGLFGGGSGGGGGGGSGLGPDAITSAFNTGGAGLSATELYGFAAGGSFDVSEKSAVASFPGFYDNRLIAFRANDNEKVTISPKNEGRQAGRAPVAVHLHGIRDFDTFHKNHEQLATDAYAFAASMMAKNKTR